ncbi:nuclear apoptosis-inducing factor 1 [Sphaerodactylus townsendi]|uniref:nuclear apoptosis-inducing factor 1 n=1 Tax=Sphaerodactylus townsendi TaxID=933632 RepID=UPI0020270666|nr:nuclear apoptosis-inducing factor 1 [Sphaerodactylus townsendi]XP_048367920.1 nuclear apoptosis-inducing factor 1 [Sphaerodactylus townsendi]
MAMSSPPAPPAKKRKMNFSEREVEIIVEELERSKHLLINHFNAGVSLAAKATAWHNILRRVNAVATCHRELHEVKKKWSDLKTEVRRKVAQVRVAMEGGDVHDGTGEGQDAEEPTGATTAPVILTPMQQRICNLLGEATIISLPAGDCTAADGSELPITAAATTVTLTQIPAETTYHSLEDGVVEYCTSETPTTVTAESPLEMMAQQAEVSMKPQELKSRIALNSAKLLQEQRVTNLHVKEIAHHLEQQNDLLQMIRRSQEVQACAQERQAQAMEGTQAALSALIQILRPMIKDFRRFLQSNTPAPPVAVDPGQAAQNGQQDGIIQ